VLPPVNSAHRRTLAPIATPDRLLLGPGPSNAHPTVLQALARMPIGHLDPLYVELMGEVQELLRYAWQTDNRLTIPMSGTGSAAMEASLANTIEPGDTVLVAVKGYFGLRLADMAGRYRANVVTIEKPWGGSLQPGRTRERRSHPSAQNSGHRPRRDIHRDLPAHGGHRRSLP
jgi:alanine-glyoxylate transaminase / serine-glyoxylate transaminase / serine-pyruvate transaminase